MSDEPHDNTGFVPTGDNYQSCPACSLPHPLTDTVCSFCGAKLPGKVTVSEKINRTVQQARWRYQKRSRMGAAKATARKVGAKMTTVLVGLLLSLAGGYLTATAVEGGSFGSGLFGLVFLSYGLYALYHAARS